MRDQLLILAGGLAITVAIAHAVIGERTVFVRAKIEPPRSRILLRLVWQSGAVAWAALGALLMMAPLFGSQSARTAIVIMAAATFLPAAAGNAYATRGRHPGWMLLCIVVIAAILGR